MQSLDQNNGHQIRPQASLSVERGSGIVLPRFLRKSVRRLHRLLSGGFKVTRRGIVATGICVTLAVATIAFSNANNVSSAFARTSTGLGLGISQYQISGNTEVSDQRIAAILAPSHEFSILNYDVNAARDLLLANPWISNAKVSKVFPNKLVIKIDERKPFALWQNEEGLQLINREGFVLSVHDGRKHELPLVVGAGAEKLAGEIIETVKRFPDVARRVTAMIRVGDRRWDLELDGSMRVLLPEVDPAAELARLTNLDRSQAVLSKDIDQIDLRFSDRMIVRLPERAKSVINGLRKNQIENLVKARKERNT